MKPSLRLSVLILLAVVAGAVALAPSVLGHGRHEAGRPPFDLSTVRGQPVLAGFSPRDLAVGAAPGEIPAIIRPRFDSAAAAAALLSATDLVVGVDIRGDSRAYPVRLLALHEAVNDDVGGKPIVVTWCPLCASALVFDRRVAGRVLTFDVSGLLYQANQVLFDRQTRSLWSQLAGGAVTGAMRGHKLALVPATEQLWAVWRAAHPQTRVLSIRHDVFAQRFVHPFSYVDARGEERSDDPYAGYQQKVSVYYGAPIDGISGAERVVGLELGGRAKAYPDALLSQRCVVNDRVAGVPLAVFWGGFGTAPSVFSRRLGNRLVRFRCEGGTIRDSATASRWNPESGRAAAGRLAGAALRPLPFTYPYWFAWRAFHPRTLIAGR